MNYEHVVETLERVAESGRVFGITMEERGHLLDAALALSLLVDPTVPPGFKLVPASPAPGTVSS